MVEPSVGAGYHARMFRNIRATMLLADHVQAAEGKLNVMGGGWRWTGPEPSTFGIGVVIEFPWESVGEDHVVKLELIDNDGAPVDIPQGDGEAAPFSFEATVGVVAPPGSRRGTPVNVCMGINVVQMQLPHAGRFEFRMEIDGDTEEDWRVGFSTRPEGDRER
jgi:hypothetical protein